MFNIFHKCIHRIWTWSLINEFNVVGGKHSLGSIGSWPNPPSLVYLVNVGDDIIWVEADLIVFRCKKQIYSVYLNDSL